MDIFYGLLMSFAFIVVSVWLALKLWDIVERDFKARVNREPDQKEQLRHGVRDYGDGWGDSGGGGFGGGDGGGG